MDELDRNGWEKAVHDCFHLPLSWRKYDNYPVDELTQMEWQGLRF